MFYIYFKILVAKEWPDHRQSHLLLCNWMFNWGVPNFTFLRNTIKISYGVIFAIDHKKGFIEMRTK